MVKPTTIRLSKKGKERLRKLKKRGDTFEKVIFRDRPLLTSLISKSNLRKLERKSFIERNAIIQDVLEELERRRIRKQRK